MVQLFSIDCETSVLFSATDRVFEFEYKNMISRRIHSELKHFIYVNTLFIFIGTLDSLQI